MKIVLFGKNGQLGWELNRTLYGLGELVALDYPEVDFEKPRNVVSLLNDIKPDLIVNAAAYTDVDRAEIEKEKARLVNAETPGEIANWCKKNGSILIHYSTDYVFDGKKGSLYTEVDYPNPINYYGKTKYEGEKAIKNNCEDYLILRTAWLYSNRGKNFVLKIIELLKQNAIVRVVDDQFGNPTWARMLAKITSDILRLAVNDIKSFFQDKSGLYHCASKGYCSRYDWAEKIILYYSSKKPAKYLLLRAKSNEYKSLAKRPCFSGLNSSKLETVFGLTIESWERSLISFFNEG